jgi:hypothetical protein
MLQNKSVKELKELLITLNTKLEKMRPNRKSNSSLLSEDDKIILQSNAPELEKKKWVISKILDVRINLFAEYSKEIDAFEQKKDFDNAIKLMNEYITNLAIPFTDITKKPSSKRFLTLFKRDNLLTPTEYIQKWKNDYELWFKPEKTPYHALSEFQKTEKFRAMQTTFYMIYHYSFSRDNVPERQAFVIYDPNKVKFP